MYGYFDLIGACLKNNERSVFNSYYCRLCYCLWNKGGQKARYLTTYDAAVYNLVMAVAGKDERPPCFDCERIKTNNKKHFKDDPIGYIIADLSILGFATKAKDNAADNRNAISTNHVGSIPFKPWYRKKEMVPPERHSPVTMPIIKKTGTTTSAFLPFFQAIAASSFIL